MKTLREAREAAGLTQAALADLAATTQPQIRRLEAGERKLTREWAQRLAPHLRIEARALLFPDSPPQSGFRPPPDFLGERDLPVFAAAEGGDGAMVVSTDPIEVVPRPWYMREVKDGYAVLIVGESMIPAYEPGDMAIVNPRLPPMRNKNAIFVTGEHGGRNGGEFKATIKRLLSWDSKNWRVHQFNEPKDFVLSRTEWPKALRVVGKYEG